MTPERKKGLLDIISVARHQIDVVRNEIDGDMGTVQPGNRMYDYLAVADVRLVEAAARLIDAEAVINLTS